ncbi:MAG: hypothetical protein IKP88_06045 [Lachnospiraceae bacterium]|nr:hypothetical protein [Lachnospiraceae bacterium]
MGRKKDCRAYRRNRVLGIWDIANLVQELFPYSIKEQSTNVTGMGTFYVEPNDLITKLSDIKEAGISVVNLNKDISKKMKKMNANS